MERLPKSIDYSSPLATLPDGTVNYLVSSTPINNSSFVPGSTIIVDLNNVPGFLDPASLSFRYKYTATSNTSVPSNTSVAPNVGIVGCPAYTPFLRVDILANSAVVESINNYNTLATMLTNVGLNIADKFGQQSSLGFCGTTGDANMDNQNDTDGIVLATYITASATATATAVTYSNYISAPLIGCSLGYAEKLVPMDYVSWRVQLTLDSLANIGSQLSSDVSLSAYTITNFELVYNQIQFPLTINQQIKMSNPKIRIKTKSFGVGSQSLPVGSGGTANLYYNLRFASVRSLFLICAPTSTVSASRAMEAVDPTSNNGSIQFAIGGIVLPQNPLSTINNKSGILNELRRAQGSVYDKNNSMAIGGSEFKVVQGDTTSITIPGKFYVGVNTQKLTESQDYMFTGISSANSQINVILSLGTTTTASMNAYLIANYDAIFEIDTLTKQMNYIQ
jgi:hypothetical protein